MSKIRFRTKAPSTSMTIDFSRNQAYPRSAPVAAPARTYYRDAAGGVHYEEHGHQADLELTWTATTPMTADDHDALLTFFRYTRGLQDQWTFTDDDGAAHDAWFMDGLDSFTQHAHGFAGTLLIRIRS